MIKTRTLGILVFDDAEVLDFCGPFEVFSVAKHQSQPPGFYVHLVAPSERPVLARNGLSLNADCTVANCPKLDLLLIPGGQGTRREMNNDVLIQWIKARAQDAELVMSVCTGSLLLAKAGILDGLEATTHHAAMDLLRQLAPRTKIHEDRRFVDNGKVICSAGIAAGIDMSLHVVGRLLGADAAQRTARHMEYPHPA